MTDDSLSVLRSIRIGAVPYLNAKPLVYGFPGEILFKHPSLLAEDFTAGRVDVALLPLRSVLEMENILVVDGISISSFGPVYSVFLAYRGMLEDVRRIYLDPASRSSANLLRVLSHRFLKIEPEFLETDAGDGDARLLIGDQAIHFRKNMAPGWNVLDLGEAWTKFTGLPFVYAVWVLGKNVSNASQLAEFLRGVKTRGLEAISLIVEDLPLADREMAGNYFQHCIRYDLGEAEKCAIASFADCLVEQKLIKKAQGLCYA